MASNSSTVMCPHCKNDDESMMTKLKQGPHEVSRNITSYICDVCSKLFRVKADD